ncbi:FAD-linked oxidoreductase-like protein [Phycomyces blakesleeanus]
MHLIRTSPKRLSTFRSSPKKSSSNLKKALCGTFALVSTTTTLFSVNQVYGHKPPHPAAHQNTRTSNSLAQITIAELQDNESQAAVSQKSTRELVLAYAVYQLCTLPWLVDASPCLINLASQSSFSFLIKDPIYWVIKNTFFRQFCGGETAEECQPIMERLEQAGVKSILDLCVESDDHGIRTTASKHQKYYQDQDQGHGQDHDYKNHNNYQPAKSDTHISLSAFSAIKITALTSPEFLTNLNSALSRLQTAFDDNQVNGYLSLDILDQIIQSHLPPPQSDAQLVERKRLVDQLTAGERRTGTSSGGDGVLVVDQVQFDSLFDFQGPYRKIWWDVPDKATYFLSNKDWKDYDRVVNRLEDICQLAKELGIGIMIDAEQSYYQEAIDHFALHLQQKFNRIQDTHHEALVYNTYQMYTKSGQHKLERDTRRAEQKGFTLAVKLVRGAYMVSETKRAKDLGYPSPIQDTLEDTHASFNGAILFLLNKLQEHHCSTRQILSPTTSPVVFMIASHNRESVVLTVEEMERHHVSPQSGVIQFGQLYGMQDQISYILGKNGYSTYKYLPYGMIDQVLPYLVRRVQENSAVLESVSKEQQLLLQEIKKRFLFKKEEDPEITPPV